jgi:hypothetical protein
MHWDTLYGKGREEEREQIKEKFYAARMALIDLKSTLEATDGDVAGDS